MPQLDNTGQRVRRTPVGPSVFASPYTSARKNAAVESLGRRISAFGEQAADAALRMDAMDRSRQVDDAQTEYWKFYNEHLNEAQNNNNFTEWPKQFEAAHDQWTQGYMSKVTSPGAQRDLAQWLEKQKVGHAGEITSAASKNYRAETRSRLPGLVARYIDQAAEADPKGEAALRAELGKKLVEYGNQNVIYTGDAEKMLADFDKGLEPVRQAKAFANARQMVMAIGDRAAAEATVDSLSGVLDRPEREDLLAQIGRKFDIEEAVAKTQLEAQREKDRAAIWDKMLKKDFVGIEAFIRGTSLDIDEQKKQVNDVHTWAKQVNKGIEIESDKREEARLEKMALDVSTGAVSLAEFGRQAMDAAYGEKPTIDSAAFDSLMGVANREHQTYQAAAMKEAVGFAEDQLLSKSATEERLRTLEMLSADEDVPITDLLRRVAEEQKYEQTNFAEYRRALSEWFQAEKAGGKEPTDDDIYIQSRKMLVHFRGRRPVETSIEGPSEPVEPPNQAEFERRVREIAGIDRKAALEYYEKWGVKWR